MQKASKVDKARARDRSRAHLSLMNNVRLANDQDCAKRLTLSDRGI
jgi:hypothetical protein